MIDVILFVLLTPNYYLFGDMKSILDDSHFSQNGFGSGRQPKLASDIQNASQYDWRIWAPLATQL
jgi:hypothetical protein